MGNKDRERRESNPSPFVISLLAAALVICTSQAAAAQTPPTAFVDAATVVPGLGPQPDVEIVPPEHAEPTRQETEAEEQARVLAKLRELGGTKTEERSE